MILIRNCTTSTSQGANNYHGIYLGNTDNGSIVNNKIMNNPGSGLGIGGSSSINNTVLNNNITGNTFRGIYLNSADFNNISLNNISNNGDMGIYGLSGCNDNIIDDNDILGYDTQDEGIFLNTNCDDNNITARFSQVSKQG